MTLTHDRRTALLGGCPLFTGVGPEDLSAIGERAVEVEFATDHVIARQGEIGTGLFVIIEGEVRVIRDAEELGPPVLGERHGSSFGAGRDAARSIGAASNREAVLVIRTTRSSSPRSARIRAPLG